MKIIELTGAVAADGTGTLTNTQKVHGYIEKIQMDYIDGATGADLTFSIEGITSQTILTITNAGTSDIAWYPRSAGTNATGTAYTNWATKYFMGKESLKVVIAEGGVSKSFRFLVYVSDGNA